jgi:hypothetical protein
MLAALLSDILLLIQKSTERRRSEQVAVQEEAAERWLHNPEMQQIEG